MFALEFTPGPEEKPWDQPHGYPVILGRLDVVGVTFADVYGAGGSCGDAGVWRNPGPTPSALQAVSLLCMVGIQFATACSAVGSCNKDGRRPAGPCAEVERAFCRLDKRKGDCLFECVFGLMALSTLTAALCAPPSKHYLR